MDIWKRSRAGCAALLIGLFAAIGANAAEPSPKERVAAALDNMMTLERPGEMGLATFWDGNKYVQCRPDFEDFVADLLRKHRTHTKSVLHPFDQQPTSDAKLAPGVVCEAAGSRMQPSLAHVIAPDRLASLGWKSDPAFGNFVRAFPADMPLSSVADHVLEVLSQGYGADPAQLEIRTQWVALEPCPPRNGPTQNLAGMINDAKSMASTAVHDCSYGDDEEELAPVRSAQDLVDRYGRRVSGELQRLRIDLSEDNIFLILDTDSGYIQCRPRTSPKAIYCEAESAESWPVIASIITPERLARLHAVGFGDPGRGPNYSKTYALDEGDNAAIARELLSVLYDVYGYNGASELRVETERDSQRARDGVDRSKQ